MRSRASRHSSTFRDDKAELTLQLGEYMLKGWTLTDLHCDQCRATPLMREPAALARNEGRTPIQFCALCDGGPEGRANSAASSSYTTAASTPSEEVEVVQDSSLASTPVRQAIGLEDGDIEMPPTPPSPLSPPGNHTASARGDPDAAADAISQLLLKGYSLLQTVCPTPSCRGVPLVGMPRNRDGTRNPARECVSCGNRWVDERDLAQSGLRVQEPAPVPQPSTSTSASVTPTAISMTSTIMSPPASWATAAPVQVAESATPESPRSRARRELYAQGASVMAERQAAAEAQAEKEASFAAAAAAEAEKLVAAAHAETTRSAGYSLPSQLSREVAAPAPLLPADSTPSSSSRPPFVSADHRPDQPDGKLRVVVITTGSVASIKLPNIVAELCADGNVEVQVVATKSSLHFYDKAAVEAAHPGVNVWTDVDEWSDWKKIGDPILHIELRRWADLVVIAPTSADILAKIAGGLCDNLALSLLRALSPETPVILCPAMNTHMYAHPMTERHLSFIRQVLKYYILGPQGAGMLACGDVGAGKMTEWKDIVQAILGYAAVWRNRTDHNDSSMLDALLSGSVPALATQNEIEFQLPPIVQTRPTRSPQVHARHLPSYETINVEPPRPKKSVRASHSAESQVVSQALAVPLHLLQYLLLPLLWGLHLMFTISSIILRVVQAQPATPVELTKDAPSHLGLILVPGKGPRKAVADRYVESTRRAIQWAGEWGVSTISVWDGEGLGVQYHGAVTASLHDLPPSPPSSAPSSPPETVADEVVPTLGDETVTKSVYVNTCESSPARPMTICPLFIC